MSPAIGNILPWVNTANRRPVTRSTIHDLLGDSFHMLCKWFGSSRIWPFDLQPSVYELVSAPHSRRLPPSNKLYLLLTTSVLHLQTIFRDHSQLPTLFPARYRSVTNFIPELPTLLPSYQLYYRSTGRGCSRKIKFVSRIGQNPKKKEHRSNSRRK